MCGRFTQTDQPLSGLEIALEAQGTHPEALHCNRFNGAPGQDFWVIQRHPQTGDYRRDRLVWGLIPHWCKDAHSGRKSINARSETLNTLPSFRSAYAKRRCLIPIDNSSNGAKQLSRKSPSRLV